MAYPLVSSVPVSFGTKPKKIAAPITPDSSPKRRSGNYPPSLWNHDHLQLLTNNYKGDEYVKQVEELKGKVKTMLTNLEGGRLLDQLEMIDDLLRLGVAYHFDDEIHNILGNIYKNRGNDQMKNDNLYETALKFRLLREHGYDTSPEIFESFRDSTGKFRVSLCKDIKGMLSLYEASYHSFEGESTMEEAWHFTSKHLRSYVDGSDHHVDPFLAIQVTHALELPLHWRMARSEASWYIEHVYERRADFNPVLLQLAKLDFNILQGLHQEELKDLSRWWKNIDLGEKLSFARNRLVESFFWAVGAASKPQFGNFRKIVAKGVALATVIDDIYDVYGTLDELELFTDAVERWDIKAIKQLPDYMKICFLALYNTVNEMAYDILKEQGHDVLWNLQKTWVDLLRSYLMEARWCHSGHTPTFDEYMKNAWISIACVALITQGSLFVTNQINIKELEFLESYPELSYWTCLISRLQDDLGTSSEEIKKGDAVKSIQCYMNENRVSEEVAREHIKNLTREAWKKVNMQRADVSPLTQTIIGIMLDTTRTFHCLYLHGDGHGYNLKAEKHVVSTLLFDNV